MGSSTNHVLTLANCIIGVSVLTMPFCFKQCGIALATLMLILSSLITKLSCHYLIKSAIMEKMKNFEMLAFRAFGPTGKTMVELCIIGFMLGSCVAFFVIMGDLGPTIVGPAFGIEHVSALRPSVLIGMAIFVVLPLGLLKNVDSLSTICTASIVFYMFLVLKVVTEAGTNLLTENWFFNVSWWRPSGILQCIPIFSMALSCQTQLFGIFDSLPNAQLERTNAVIRLAINMTTIFYIAVGFFGYTAYYNQSFSGNLMLSFSPTWFSQIMKMGFLISIAVSFPLVIFPCRASIYSFLYSKIQYGYEGVNQSHIPETTFQCITFGIVTLSLIIGLILPDIEVVIGLVGSTIGVFVCLIIPGMIFNSLSSKKNNEKLVAQCLVGIGLIIMVLGTYANMFATENMSVEVKKKYEKKVEFDKEIKERPLDLDLPNIVEKPVDPVRLESPKQIVQKPDPVQPKPPKEIIQKPDPVQPEPPKEIVHKPDPVQPEPPKEIVQKPHLVQLEPSKEIVQKLDPKPKEIVQKPVNPVETPKEILKKPAEPVQQIVDKKPADLIESKEILVKLVEPVHPEPEKVPKIEEKEIKKSVPDMIQDVKKPLKIYKKVLKIADTIKNVSQNSNKSILYNITADIANGIPLPIMVQNAEKIKEKPQSRDILHSDREKREIEDPKDEKCVKTEIPLNQKIEEINILDNIKLPHLEISFPQTRDLKSLSNKTEH